MGRWWAWIVVAALAGCASPSDPGVDDTPVPVDPSAPIVASVDDDEEEEGQSEPCPVREGPLSGARLEVSPLPNRSRLLDVAEATFPEEDHRVDENAVLSGSSTSSMNGQQHARFGPLAMDETDPEGMQETMLRWHGHMVTIKDEMGFDPEGSWLLKLGEENRPDELVFTEPVPEGWQPTGIMGIHFFRGNWSAYWTSPYEVHDAPGEVMDRDALLSIAYEHFQCRYGIRNESYEGSWSISWAPYCPDAGATARIAWEFTDSVPSLHIDPWTGTIVGGPYGFA